MRSRERRSGAGRNGSSPKRPGRSTSLPLRLSVHLGFDYAQADLAMARDMAQRGEHGRAVVLLRRAQAQARDAEIHEITRIREAAGLVVVRGA